MIMQEFETKITFSKTVADGFFRIRFPVRWKKFDPGQFVMVSVPGNASFLRRPFGIVQIEKGEAEVCFKVVGRGTRAISEAPIGTETNVLGPCGRGFDLKVKFKTAVLIAGGYGIAPLVGLAAKLGAKGREAILYYGGRDKKHLLYLNEIRRTGSGIRITTEDGSAGEKGVITDRLQKELGGIETPAFFVCGPHGLIASAAKIGIEKNIPTQVSLETHMACGLGVCLGCVCKDSSGEYVRVCREGPVFDIKDVR